MHYLDKRLVLGGGTTFGAGGSGDGTVGGADGGRGHGGKIFQLHCSIECNGPLCNSDKLMSIITDRKGSDREDREGGDRGTIDSTVVPEILEGFELLVAGGPDQNQILDKQSDAIKWLPPWSGKTLTADHFSEALAHFRDSVVAFVHEIQREWRKGRGRRYSCMMSVLLMGTGPEDKLICECIVSNALLGDYDLHVNSASTSKDDLRTFMENCSKCLPLPEDFQIFQKELERKLLDGLSMGDHHVGMGVIPRISFESATVSFQT